MSTPMNPNKDFQVSQPPDDTVSALEFSPATIQQNFLVAGSFDNSVRCWEIEQTGYTVPKAIQSMTMPILDICWAGNGTQVFMASCDKQVKLWDLGSNQTIQVASHEAPVKTCHWIKTPSYTCLMTGSWDRTLKFWDVRSAIPIMTLTLPERVYCVDVDYPMAIVGTASKGLFVFKLEGKPEMVKTLVSPLNYQHRCVAIFRNEKNQHPIGFGLGSIDGHVAIQYIYPQPTKKNYVFKCHRFNSNHINVLDNCTVNDIKFHPIHGTLVTVGSDASYSFWNKDTHKQIKSSVTLNQPITKCCFNSNGQILAYSIGYDWSKGLEHMNPSKKPQIYFNPCFEDLKPESNN